MLDGGDRPYMQKHFELTLAEMQSLFRMYFQQP